MYKIIGGDGKQYGPVSGEQIQTWISEGRASGQTQVQREGEIEWQPLSGLPEFAAALAAQAQTQTIPSLSLAAAMPGEREAAVAAVRGPALALQITTILGVVGIVFGLAINIMTLIGIQLPVSRFEGQHGLEPEMEHFINSLSGGVGLVQNLIGLAVAVVIFKGVAKMQRLENFQFAMTTCILAIVPCVSPCCLLGLPFGIWALTVINRPEVKRNFV